jgi:putative ABC transport system substrate-binding protein
VPAGPIEGLNAGLTELGLLEGQNIRLELRVANGDLSKLPAFAAELVGRNVELVAAIGAVTARGLLKTTVLPVILLRGG